MSSANRRSRSLGFIQDFFGGGMGKMPGNVGVSELVRHHPQNRFFIFNGGLLDHLYVSIKMIDP